MGEGGADGGGRRRAMRGGCPGYHSNLRAGGARHRRPLGVRVRRSRSATEQVVVQFGCRETPCFGAAILKTVLSPAVRHAPPGSYSCSEGDRPRPEFRRIRETQNRDERRGRAGTNARRSIEARSRAASHRASLYLTGLPSAFQLRPPGYAVQDALVGTETRALTAVHRRGTLGRCGRARLTAAHAQGPQPQRRAPVHARHVQETFPAHRRPRGSRGRVAVRRFEGRRRRRGVRRDAGTLRVPTTPLCTAGTPPYDARTRPGNPPYDARTTPALGWDVLHLFGRGSRGGREERHPRRANGSRMARPMARSPAVPLAWSTRARSSGDVRERRLASRRDRARRRRRGPQQHQPDGSPM
ncbi:hypothetical protein C8Q77DRAFT_877924 [Trametes polyzona]|nr:hypothetical protein C8Q77DRAFT_877924 [Trametes polyzona]